MAGFWTTSHHVHHADSEHGSHSIIECHFGNCEISRPHECRNCTPVHVVDDIPIPVVKHGHFQAAGRPAEAYWRIFQHNVVAYSLVITY